MKRKSQSSENGDRRRCQSWAAAPSEAAGSPGRGPLPSEAGVSPAGSGSEVRRRGARSGRAGGALPRDCLEEALAVSLSRFPAAWPGTWDGDSSFQEERSRVQV